MRDLFLSGRLADLILLLVAVEAPVLVWLARRRGWPVAGILANLAAGFFLVLALRLVLAGADWIWPAAALGVAGLAHLGDLGARFGRDP